MRACCVKPETAFIQLVREEGTRGRVVWLIEQRPIYLQRLRALKRKSSLIGVRARPVDCCQLDCRSIGDCKEVCCNRRENGGLCLDPGEGGAVCGGVEGIEHLEVGGGVLEGHVFGAGAEGGGVDAEVVGDEGFGPAAGGEVVDVGLEVVFYPAGVEVEVDWDGGFCILFQLASRGVKVEDLLMTSRELASPSEEISLRNAMGLARSGFAESISSSVAPYAWRTAASTARS